MKSSFLSIMLVPAAAAVLFLCGVSPAHAKSWESWKETNARVVWLYGQGRIEEALPLAKEALQAAEAAYPSEDPSVAAALNNLASLHLAQGNAAQAKELYQRALAMNERLLGPDHPSVAANRENLEQARRAQENPQSRQPAPSAPSPQPQPAASPAPRQSPPAKAAGVGIPAGSEENRLGITMEYSRLFDRDLEAPAQETDEISLGNAAHLRLSYALFDWFQPHAKVGAAEFTEDLGNVNIVGLGRRNISLEYDWALSWGGGAGGIHRFEDSGWFVGYAGEYLTSSHDLERAVEGGEVATRVAGEVDIEKWFGGGFAGYTFDFQSDGDFLSDLSVYLGGRYSDFELENSGIEYDVSSGTTTRTGKAEADDHFGLFAGFTLRMGERWQVAVEGRFIDETALTGQATCRF